MWEDPANNRGGRWVLQLQPGQIGDTALDQLWLETLLMIIGETLGNKTAISH